MNFRAIAFFAALSATAAHGASLINVQFSGPMTPVQQQTFLDAAAYWNSVITGYDLVHDHLGDIVPHSLTITASVPDIDGSGGTLGAAGPTDALYYDNDPFSPNPTVALFYATEGIMEFDSADVTALVASNLFYSVVLHEMAHVLGIGTLWPYNNNLNGTTYPLYTTTGQYTGPNALAAWRTEFNQPAATFVPVELGGGPGTADGHWNENDGGLGLTGFTSNLTGLDFTNELMTGWASSTFFVSTVTLGALDDLGYIVDYSKAGIVNHVVMVPETSTAALALASLCLLTRRRRP